MASMFTYCFLLFNLYHLSSGFSISVSKRCSTIELFATGDIPNLSSTNRRLIIQNSAYSIMGSVACSSTANVAYPDSAAAESGALDQSNQFAPDFVQTYADFTTTVEGWKYRDVKLGNGEVQIKPGDRLVYDWSGYTIGYFGRPFEAKGGPQGGAFDKNIDYFRTVVGSNTVIPALEKAMLNMKPGGIRQVLVPYGPLSYPPDDLEHIRVGPKPTTFSGQRALNFVLENPRIDRTLLFNVKLVRVDKMNEKGGYTRVS